MDDLTFDDQKNENVPKLLATILRSLIDLDLLKVIYRAVALIGFHLVESFLSLTTLVAYTTCTEIIPTFPHLGLELTDTHASTLLNLKDQNTAFTFKSIARFTNATYDQDICIAIAHHRS